MSEDQAVPSEESKLKETIEDKLFLVKYKPDKESHIQVDQVKFKADRIKAVLYICPAKTYELNEETGECMVAFENCLECGTCKVACAEYVKWVYPRGGFGVQYRFG
ncbi:MAG: 4Fe-4S dicluster domain-containing protein [bacterium]|nr:4Fe-4S dicluster domain-containing protein [bacterium]